MSASTRLLATVSVANVVHRSLHVASLQHELKILHMLEIPSRHLSPRNFCKTALPSEALLPRVNPIERKQAMNPMEPYMETCFVQPTSAAHEIIDLCNSQESDTDDSSVRTCDLCSVGSSVSEEEILECDVRLKVKWPKRAKKKHAVDKCRYKSMRKWQRVDKDRTDVEADENFVLKLLSFNILAQNLLESHLYLYRKHDSRALPWETRKYLLLQEIIETQANVICLQEMQEEHLNDFLVPFKALGYQHIYKRRTNDKRDGLLFLYRADQFDLLDHVKVEYYQAGVELLNRDNVAIVAKLALKSSPATQFIIATTHLLYNPKRNDIRLGQTQILLAEIERLAFVEDTTTGTTYLPIIMSGDFNLLPHSGVYEFITKGVFEYAGKGRTLEPSEHRRLSNYLIPPRLQITDSCQHYDVLKKRILGEANGTVMLDNSESNDAKEHSQDIDMESACQQRIKLGKGRYASFGSGQLSHQFRMKSVYSHRSHDNQREATTNQGDWITVDYIFFSDFEVLEKYTLLSEAQCKHLPRIPNFAVGSDHFCLGASFLLKKKR